MRCPVPFSRATRVSRAGEPVATGRNPQPVAKGPKPIAFRAIQGIGGGGFLDTGAVLVGRA
jgi:hypothetical protein